VNVYPRERSRIDVNGGVKYIKLVTLVDYLLLERWNAQSNTWMLLYPKVTKKQRENKQQTYQKCIESN